MRIDPELAPVLVERARRLARPMTNASTAPASAGLLHFLVNNEALAVATEAVVEVQLARRPAPLPGLPGWLAGMVGVHGRILPAVWLDRFLGGGSGAERDALAEQVIVVQADGVLLALLATGVEGFAPGSGSELQSLPPGLSAEGSQCAIGIQDEHLVLDASQLVRAIAAALGSSTPGVRRPPLIEAHQGAQSHANQT